MTGRPSVLLERSADGLLLVATTAAVTASASTTTFVVAAVARHVNHLLLSPVYTAKEFGSSKMNSNN